MVDKKKELSDKELKKASGGAFAAGEKGGHKGTRQGPRAGHVTGQPRDAGTVEVKPKSGHIRPV